MKQLFIISIISLVSAGWLCIAVFAIMSGSQNYDISNITAVVLASLAAMFISKYIIRIIKMMTEK